MILSSPFYNTLKNLMMDRIEYLGSLLQQSRLETRMGGPASLDSTQIECSKAGSVPISFDFFLDEATQEYRCQDIVHQYSAVSISYSPFPLASFLFSSPQD